MAHFHPPASYRLVHFIPDPFTEGRVPIAALVEADGHVSVVKAPMPCACSLGGRSGEALLTMGLQALDHAKRFVELPRSMGPHFTLGDPRDVPAGVDAVAWVGNLFYRPSAPTTDVATPAPAVSATTRVAKHILETWGRSGRKVFRVEEFVEAGLGSEGDVVEALLKLERRGAVKVRTAVRCPNGHTIWDGPPREVEHPMQCQECGEPTADDPAERNDLVRAILQVKA